ncbi:hypothetical protein MOQ_004856 [Trypanosoma cruzi marinkellei]|uniref:Uncharacterized protein n=1 Tax=Trypanosoma cruzi marinkellei TaxID=85056 RepID=K2MZV4_TRYCR|nr:hypothetical protein MOQ_004856 [Trypanosoma cruzi marinkellei]
MCGTQRGARVRGTVLVPRFGAAHGPRSRPCKAERSQYGKAPLRLPTEFAHARAHSTGIPEIDVWKGRRALHGGRGGVESRCRRWAPLFLPAFASMKHSQAHSATTLGSRCGVELIMPLSLCCVIRARSSARNPWRIGGAFERRPLRDFTTTMNVTGPGAVPRGTPPAGVAGEDAGLPTQSAALPLLGNAADQRVVRLRIDGRRVSNMILSWSAVLWPWRGPQRPPPRGVLGCRDAWPS